MILRKLLVIPFLALVLNVLAGEGMWLPQLLGQLNEKDMKALGMKISAKDIYSVNQGSLKDAVLSFGGFCTGEVISPQGLVLTNHHCGFDAIQNNSTLEHNYIKDGFWAVSQGEEIPNPGLYVTFIIRIDDITAAALTGVNPEMNEKERLAIINRNIETAEKNTKKELWQKTMVKAFFEGNQYFLFVTETYNDVRLVGAPPSSIGNFGQDTDNWIWPRHTGDFSVFRIYAGKDNKPAPYAPDNVPYKPKSALSVSLDGVAEGDFTMVFGFPGRTNEYLYSAAVEQIMNASDPSRVAIREKALAVLDEFMRKDEAIKIQYAAKYARISNYWKKWQGEISGLKKTHALEKKQKYETEFLKRVNARPGGKEKYGGLQEQLEKAYMNINPYSLAKDYFNETIGRIELFGIASQLNSLVNAFRSEGKQGYEHQLEPVRSKIEEIFKEYNTDVDRKLFEELIQMYVKGQEERFVSPKLKQQLEESGGSFDGLATKVYSGNNLLGFAYINDLLSMSPGEVVEILKQNATINLYTDILHTYAGKVEPELTDLQDNIDLLQRRYMKAQMEVFKEKKFYPDANGTMRVAYGKVSGYNPRDAVHFNYQTHLTGAIEKYKPGDYEFDMPEKLIKLWDEKNYGPYGVNGRMPVCFIATNHTTGGNSGSPVLDAYGNLMGLNFDRVWEGTMSDINFDPSLCRNIMVDIRYVLFIMDKFAGAERLIKEMKLVHPKSGKAAKAA